MAKIEFSLQQKQALVDKIQRYFDNELEQEIGQFDAEFLLDFFATEIGPAFYNQALLDAQSALESKLDDVRYAIQDLEKSETTT